MQATAKLFKTGQITIPREIRLLLDLQPGDYVTFDVIGKQEKIGTKQGNGLNAPCPA